MGMDIYGNNGEDFSVSIFNWPAYLHAMEASGLDVPDDWQYNDGAGLTSQSECDRYANALERWLGNAGISSVVLSPSNIGNRVLVEAFRQQPVTAVSVRTERLQDWIRFLRSCGGFRIL